MKKGLILITLFFLVIFSCTKSNPIPPPPEGSTSDVNLKSGLLVYLPFDGNIADSSGNGNPTTAVGGASLTYDEHGNANSAFGGTGSGQRILVTNNGSIKLDTAFSLSFDIMLRAPGRCGLVNFVDNTNGQGYSFGVGTNSLSPNNLIYAVGNTDNCGSIVSPTNITSDSMSLVPANESWYNMVFTFHNGVLNTYINGALFSTKNGANAPITICPSGKMIIGGWWDGDPTTINGKLDEIRLYNRVINADEIAELSKEFH